MTPRTSTSEQTHGTVSLVALCFVAVLGIVLASYLAICSRAMNLSNRTFQDGLSRQLAESGLEEALRAFNKNNWSDWTNGTAADWTISGTTASCNITFPVGKYGQGVVASIKVRVDNYNAAQLNATWNNTSTYLPNNLVGYNGTWYRCVVGHAPSKTPSATVSDSTSTNLYWIEEQMPLAIPWSGATNYRTEDVVYYLGHWYRATSPNSNQAPPSGSWTEISVITTSTIVAQDNDGSLQDRWSAFSSSWSWRLRNGGSWDASPPVYWYWRSGGTSYTTGDVVKYDGLWYRYTSTSTSPGDPSSNSLWKTSVNTTIWNWNSGASYKINDVVYRSSSWYRCLLAHSNKDPASSSNAAYWSNAPRLTTSWDANQQYGANDVVSYNGVWYRCLNANNGSNPSTNSTNWASAATASYAWNSSTSYTASHYAVYNGVWYDCISANSGIAPTNPSYWSAMVAPVLYAEGTVTLGDGSTIKTQLSSPIAPAPLFPNAVAATTSLVINGGSTQGTIDSYDSTLGTYGSQTPGYSAVVASTGTTSGSLSVLKTTVNGFIATPSSSTTYAPLWSYGNGAILRGTSSGASVDLTRVSRSPFIPQFDITTVTNPNSSTLTLAAGSNVTIGVPGATTPSVYSLNSGLTRSGTDTLTINGPVILNVIGAITTTGTGKIIVGASGSAEIHFDGTLSIGTGGGFDNQTLDPSKLILIGTANTSGHAYSATNAFYGVIYMPNVSAFTINTGVQIYGAISAKNITFNAEATVHYDTSLRYETISGFDQPYTITSLRELPQTEWAP